MPATQLTDEKRDSVLRRIAAGETYPAIAVAEGVPLNSVKYLAGKNKPLVERVKEAFAPQRAAERAERDAARQARTEAPILAGLREADGRTDVLVWAISEMKHTLDTQGFYIVGFGGVPQFRKGEFDVLLRALDDAAKETGGRKVKAEVAGEDGNDIAFTIRFDRSDRAPETPHD